MKVIEVVVGIVDKEPITMYLSTEGLLFWNNVNKLPIEGITIIGNQEYE